MINFYNIIIPAVPARPWAWGDGADSALPARGGEGGATRSERQNLSRHVLSLETKDPGQTMDQVREIHVDSNLDWPLSKTSSAS